MPSSGAVSQVAIEMSGVTCATLDELSVQWRELSDDYGEGGDDLWPHNTVARDVREYACGAVGRGDAPHLHDASEAVACRNLAAAAESALVGAYVMRGDEGDHSWRAFSAPAVVGDAAVELASRLSRVGVSDGVTPAGGAVPAPAGEQPAPPATALVTSLEVHAACGGAINPRLLFEPRALRGFVDDSMTERRERCGAGEEEVAVELARYRALEELLSAEGDGASGSAGAAGDAGRPRLHAASATYLRPVESREVRGCVFPHFIVARTMSGSLVGVVGNTVWT